MAEKTVKQLLAEQTRRKAAVVKLTTLLNAEKKALALLVPAIAKKKAADKAAADAKKAAAKKAADAKKAAAKKPAAKKAAKKPAPKKK
ncbi:MAG: hypothetical protein JW982_11175 [Spirochaetes bacterium]|nr:hypothetical protein [Spirochaetota bacterium]